MIVKISQPFSGVSLGKKIAYQLEKIAKEKGDYLYSSVENSPLEKMEFFMNMTSGLNDNVKNPYVEFVLSLTEGKRVSDEKFVSLACEYMERMGYCDSCYLVVKNTDTEHLHLHILATTISAETGQWISDSNNRKRSYAISRELEEKYGLEKMERKGVNRITFGESKHREYYFDNALKKALKNMHTKDRIERLLSESSYYTSVKGYIHEPLKNDVWQIALGVNLYEKVGSVLMKGRFFNPLLKDELLSALDRLYPVCGTNAELRSALEKEGYYMRMVSNKGKAHYVYGIKDQSIYFKDSSLPQKYRYGYLSFDSKNMHIDEQKHVLYNHLFRALDASSSYEEFKHRLKENHVGIVESVNGYGVVGLSFYLKDVKNPHEFKSVELSEKLSSENIVHFFSVDQKESEVLDQIVRHVNENIEDWEHEKRYVYAEVQPIDQKEFTQAVALTGLNLTLENRKAREEEDDHLPRKKKKRSNNKDRGLSM